NGKAQLPSAERVGKSQFEVGEVVAVLATDLEQVAETRREQQDEVAAGALDHGVGDDGGGVKEEVGRAQIKSITLGQPAHPLQNRCFRLLRRGQDLVGADNASFAIQ